MFLPSARQSAGTLLKLGYLKWNLQEDYSTRSTVVVLGIERLQTVDRSAQDETVKHRQDKNRRNMLFFTFNGRRRQQKSDDDITFQVIINLNKGS